MAHTRQTLFTTVVDVKKLFFGGIMENLDFLLWGNSNNRPLMPLCSHFSAG